MASAWSTESSRRQSLEDSVFCLDRAAHCLELSRHRLLVSHETGYPTSDELAVESRHRIAFSREVLTRLGEDDRIAPGW
jgi:hypothetical protein